MSQSLSQSISQLFRITEISTGTIYWVRAELGLGIVGRRGMS